MVKKVIALDIGDVRIGVSISDGLGLMAHPLKTIKWKNFESLKSELETIISEKQISIIVVGMPYTLKGELSQQTKKVIEIIDKLKSNIAIQIETIDERLTTKLAETMLKSTGKKASKNRHIIDQIAAVNILQTYLDKNRI
ncbi:MAG: Holliday junction resolvase RuvX [Calditrichaeota bacterium]|nr:MAG: Holliday junction resolvase RuvX [Calditrichota bacterium]MBL1204487.1 Holliday junction resolvase RuvX [Calditrichota bacterium]NOG44316.1 Holliday junction resolvase RuvX [Calditrichota bacterium]